MNLFIEVCDGQTVNHPALEDNLLEAFGCIPENWEPFIRKERPTPKVYEILEGDIPTYLKIDGVWTDVWPLRDMTNEEKLAKQQKVKDAFNSREYSENWSAWIFDEETCNFVPPIPRPAQNSDKLNQRVFTFWSGSDSNWKDTPAYPNDGKQYKFNFLTWSWVENV